MIFSAVCNKIFILLFTALYTHWVLHSVIQNENFILLFIAFYSKIFICVYCICSEVYILFFTSVCNEVLILLFIVIYSDFSLCSSLLSIINFIMLFTAICNEVFILQFIAVCSTQFMFLSNGALTETMLCRVITLYILRYDLV